MTKKTARMSLPFPLRSSAAALLICQTALSPAISAAATPLPGHYGTVAAPAVNALPTGGTVVSGNAVISNPTAGNLLNITQTSAKAVINWQSFNIGSAATVRFYQGTGTPGTSSWTPNSSYAALNRIYSADPTQIYGKLQADGTVYLINQNGILFGPGSQVNVGSLFASTLNLRDRDFMNDALKFTAENYQDGNYQTLSDSLSEAAYLAAVKANLGLSLPDDSAAVSNHGSISTDLGGAVYLLGPQTENAGSISTPSGVSALVAVKPLFRSSPDGTEYDLLINDVRDTDLNPYKQSTVSLASGISAGKATNFESGSITADSGLAAMYGGEVTQRGLIRAVTAVKKGGRIELLATDRITTGSASVTATPVSDATDTANATFGKKSGTIILSGLNTGEDAPPLVIDHEGSISAPSGSVYLEASQRIFLGETSQIDVSGIWVDEAATTSIVSQQLNTLNLRDDFAQKNGALLGETVWINSLYGSAIGDISHAYDVREQTAREKSTAGGKIYLGANNLSNLLEVNDSTSKEVVVSNGATIRFAGGGYRYASGTIPTTMLVSGNKAYDIASAPESLTYDKVLTSYRYMPGYTAGDDAGSLSVQARQVVLLGQLDGSVTRGAYQTLSKELIDEIGNLKTRGRKEPLGGTLTIGSNERLHTSGLLDAVTDKIELVGTTPVLPDGFGADTSLAGTSIADLFGDVSVVSTDTLNAAGLSTLSMYANQTFVMDADAALSLSPVSRTQSSGSVTGTSVTIRARSIDFLGSIDAPGGSVTLAGLNNNTSFEKDRISNSEDNPYYIPQAERIYLESGSRIDVAGERVDDVINSRNGGQTSGFAHTTGGTISLDAYSLASDGLIVKEGALLDVSGGYYISTAGKVSGGNAGSLSLAGPNILLDGEVRGFSILGKKGGKITFASENILVAAEGLHLPDGFGFDSPLGDLEQGLVLGADSLELTGFTRFELKSFNDVSLASEVTLSPSLSVMETPMPGRHSSGGIVSVTPDLVSGSSVKLTAGASRSGTTTTLDVIAQFPEKTDLFPGDTAPANLAAQVTIPSDSRIEVAPGGSITLNGPAVVISGELVALSGSIDVAVSTNPGDTYTYADNPLSGTLLIGSQALLDVSGYNKPDYDTVAGLSAGYTPLDAGTITLSAATYDTGNPQTGNVVVEEGALLDLSGSETVTRTFARSSGSPETVSVAGNPGTLSIAYQHELTLDGELAASATMAGLQGGTLTIVKDNQSTGFSLFTVDINRYLDAGFDALTFGSLKEIDISGASGIIVPRSLTFDAPVIAADGAESISIESPWLTLTNTFFPLDAPVIEGTAALELTGNFIDVAGDVKLAGFDSITLKAYQDILLTDRYYMGVNGNAATRSGLLETPGDLILQAGRIYPTTQSVFTVSSTDGTITTRPYGTPSDVIYSAFGDLTLTAALGINHQGYLAAPMGQLTFISDNGRVYLADKSVTTVAGSAMVNVGSLDNDLIWTRTDRSLTATEITGEPEKGITLDGNEVLVASGAKLDLSGGGGIFSYTFISDLNGTVNPISIVGTNPETGTVTRSERFVILSDNSVQLPGFTYTDSNGNQQVAGAVHLEQTTLSDGTVLKEGTYALLPEEYAFLPGAVIVSSLGTGMAESDRSFTQEGYTVVPGYETYLGTSVQSTVYTGYVVRSASDVLNEGHFEYGGPDGEGYVAATGGSLSVSADTAILEGDLRMGGLAGSTGGSFSLTSGNIVVSLKDGTASALANIGFDTVLPQDLSNSGRVWSDDINGKGIQELNLTATAGEGKGEITVEEGSLVTIPTINLQADKSISIQNGAGLVAKGDESGTLTLTTSSSGSILVEEGGVVRAYDTMTLDTGNIDLQGDLEVDDGVLNLIGNRLYVVDDNYQQVEADKETSLYLSDSLLGKFSRIKELSLVSRSDLVFIGDASLTVTDTLTIDTTRVGGNGVVSLTAENITLKNSGRTAVNGTAAEPATPVAGASITFNATETVINVGNSDDTTLRYANGTKGSQWDLSFDGFETVGFVTANDLTLKGVGSLKSGGDINLTAARVTTDSYSDTYTPYKSSRVAIEALNGTVNIAKGTGTAGTSTAPGGSLAISARVITASGTVELPSGRIDLTATESITLTDTARFLAVGSRTRTANSDTETYSYFSGGAVGLAADSIELRQGSLIDVSAFSLVNKKETITRVGDAGSVSLSGPDGVVLAGTISGMKGDGADDRGGSFALDAKSVDFPSLTTQLTNGGFDQELSVRARQGDLLVDSSLQAREIRIAADSGNITVAGTGVLDVSGSAGGGLVSLSAGNDLILASGSRIDASGTNGSDGGEVWLQAGDIDASNNPFGTLDIQEGAVVDLSGSTGGLAHFRAMRTTNDGTAGDIRMNLNGTVQGASQIELEGVRVWNSSVIDSTATQAFLEDTQAFLAKESAILSRLNLAENDAVRFLPGIEVRSSGDLTLSSDWGLTWWQDAGGNRLAPGVITLRSSGNLNINANLLDYPAVAGTGDPTQLRVSSLLPSWGVNLVAGADLSGADIMGTSRSSNGQLKVASGVMVYSENAPISFASAGNTVLNQAPSGTVTFWMLPSSLGTFNGTVRGTVGGDLLLNGGVIQTSTADIDLTVEGDVVLETLGQGYGTIRTTGQPANEAEYAEEGFTPEIEFFNFRDGGSIRLAAKGNVKGATQASTSWDYATVVKGNGSSGYPDLSRWSANYGVKIGEIDSTQTSITQGIATMAGGDIEIRSGGDVSSQVGTFGTATTGNLQVYAQGDITGRYLIANGNGALVAQGNIGTLPQGAGSATSLKPSIELLNAPEVDLVANGSIVLSSIKNPTLDSEFGNWYMTYARDGELTMTSLTDSVVLYGMSSGSTTFYVPPSLGIYAAEDISLRVNTILAPASDANLHLYAGGSISSGPTQNELNSNLVTWKKIWMSDMDPDEFFARSETAPRFDAYNNDHALLSGNSGIPLHGKDTEPVVIKAGHNLSLLEIYLAKQSILSAGDDIDSVFISGQNQQDDDLTSITAGRDIIFTTNPIEVGRTDQIISGIEIAGPGNLLVWAGRDIDLGNSPGIRSVGNSYNTFLGDKGSDVYVLAGTNYPLGYTEGSDVAADYPWIDTATIYNLFGVEDEEGNVIVKGLRQYGSEYSVLKAAGDKEKADEVVAEAQEKLIAPLFSKASADGGSINMVSSQISTISGKDNVYIVARDTIDVGRSSLNSDVEGKGIVTGRGGSINIFTGKDLNVNESRVMTFFGGDITIWADYGDINAGKGSKTAVSPPKFTPIRDKDNNIIGYKVSPPAVGSGLRALTYDANTRPGGDIPIPDPGDINLFAPNGAIDAGEAGIAGGKLTLGAEIYRNPENISFPAGSIGGPGTSASTVSIGSLSGTGGVSDSSRMIEQASGTGAARDSVKTATQVMDDFMAKFLDVRVISFDVEPEATTDRE